MEAVARVERCRENGAMDNKRSPQRRPASTERFSRSSYGRSRQTEPGRRPSVQGESAPTPRRVSRADYERTRARSRRRTLVIALAVVGVLVLGGAVTLAALIAPRTLMAILTSDQSLIPLGAEYLRVVAPSYFLCGIMEVCCGMVRGLGKSWLPMVVTIFGACVMRIVWIYTAFAADRALWMLYLSYPVSWIVTSAAHIACYVWARRDLERRRLEALQTAPTD